MLEFGTWATAAPSCMTARQAASLKSAAVFLQHEAEDMRTHLMLVRVRPRVQDLHGNVVHCDHDTERHAALRGPGLCARRCASAILRYIVMAETMTADALHSACPTLSRDQAESRGGCARCQARRRRPSQNVRRWVGCAPA